MKQRCFYCSAPATLLCDFHLGWAIGALMRGRDGLAWRARDGSTPPYTCDMPLCRDHAECRGWVHFKAAAPIGGFDSRDYCPEHRGIVDTGAPVMEESEADRLRRVVQANAQRRLMRERGALRSPPPAPEQGSLF
jgi:hypothetical protein